MIVVQTTNISVLVSHFSELDSRVKYRWHLGTFLQQTFESEEIIRDGSGAFCWSGYGRFVEVIGSNSSSPWVLTQPKVYKKHDIGLSPQKDFQEVSDDASVIFSTL